MSAPIPRHDRSAKRVLSPRGQGLFALHSGSLSAMKARMTDRYRPLLVHLLTFFAGVFERLMRRWLD